MSVQQRWQIPLAFAVVYIVWSSTYLAIRIGVHELPPFLLAGIRFIIAGLIIGAISRWRGERWPATRTEWRSVSVAALMFVLLGNGLVTWAEQWVPSNQAALIVTSSALWIAGFGTLGPKGVRLSGRVTLGLAIGFVGAAIMLLPKAELRLEFFGARLVLLLSAMCWGLGTALRRHDNIELPALAFAAWHMLIGGVVMTVIGLLLGEASRWQWTWAGLGALAYLTIFGSCLAYVCYTWLVNHTTPDKLGTVSYVNPALALLLGWWILDETLAPVQWLGIVVLFAGVLLVTIRRRSLKRA